MAYCLRTDALLPLDKASATLLSDSGHRALTVRRLLADATDPAAAARWVWDALRYGVLTTVEPAVDPLTTPEHDWVVEPDRHVRDSTDDNTNDRTDGPGRGLELELVNPVTGHTARLNPAAVELWRTCRPGLALRAVHDLPVPLRSPLLDTIAELAAVGMVGFLPRAGRAALTTSNINENDYDE